MKLIYVTILLVFLLGTPVLAASDNDSPSSWKKISVSYATMSYPSSWVVIEEKEKTGISFVTPEKNLLMVSVLKNNSGRTLKTLDSYIDKTSKKNNSFKLIEKDDITLSGYPGYRFEFQAKSGTSDKIMNHLQYLTETPKYSVFIAYGQKNKIDKETHDTLKNFVESFKLKTN